MTMPWTLAPMVVAPLAGLLAPRIGTRLLIVAGLAAARGRPVLARGHDVAPTSRTPRCCPPFVLAGLGMGLVFAPMSTARARPMAPADHAKATGTNSTLREIGVALGIAVLTAVFTGAGGQLTPAGYVDAAMPAVVVGASVVLLAALLALLLPGRSRLASVPVPVSPEADPTEPVRVAA